jgi:hypothetical protein
MNYTNEIEIYSYIIPIDLISPLSKFRVFSKYYSHITITRYVISI